ncbi:MAG: hypothetical protein JOZ43_05510 [Acidobacteriales bacterium]|nr:hypothetical protein [Terriglobales bacterium]
MKLILVLAALALSQQTSLSPNPAQSCQKKLDYLSQNASRQSPDPRPTAFTQDEINDYFSSGAVKLPAGVNQLHLELHTGRIVGTARIDFDQVRAGRSDNNPLLSIFTGIHDVAVDSQAEGADNKATIHILSASVDGINMPRFALELFVRKYIQPKHPDIGLDTTFRMPERVNSASVLEGGAQLEQR